MTNSKEHTTEQVTSRIQNISRLTAASADAVDNTIAISEEAISRIESMSRILDPSEIEVHNHRYNLQAEFLMRFNEAETSTEIEDLVNDWNEEFNEHRTIEDFRPHIDPLLFTYSIHVENILAKIHKRGENKFAGVDTSLNVDCNYFEQYTQLLQLIWEMGYHRGGGRPEDVSLESILFSIEELADYYTENLRLHRLQGTEPWTEEYANFYLTLTSEFPSFIMNYCRIHRMGAASDYP